VSGSWHRTDGSSGEFLNSRLASGANGQHYGAHACESGACSTHRSCTEDCEDEGERCDDGALLAAVAESDAEKIGTMLALARGHLVVNVSRNAIQRVDCLGDVVTHVELPSRLSGALATASARHDGSAATAVRATLGGPF
jgi:hypothetical protein